MKLLLPFKVGDVVRDNCGGDCPMLIIKAEGGCTCADYVDVINNHDKAKPREPHWHFVAVPEGTQPNKDGSYREKNCLYLGCYVYRNGECVEVNGPYEEWQSGWHEEDNGLDKLKLVRLAPKNFKQLNQQPKITECDDEDEQE